MQATQRATASTITEVTERCGFQSLEAEWNALVQAVADEPFHRHEFLRLWLDEFAPRAQLRVLVHRNASGHLQGALPLVAEPGHLYGVPVRQLLSASNAHSCRFDMLARDPEHSARALLGHLLSDTSWDLLLLKDVPEGGAGWHLWQSARLSGLPVGTWESLQSPFFPIPDTWESLQNRLSSKFRANCRRRRRKLEAQGRVDMECVTGGLHLEARLEEGFALERAGWKGQQGTAMAQDTHTRGFYSSLARESSRAGRLALFFLRLNGRAVAFQFGLQHRHAYFLLKPAYDEALGDCSPGQLLMEEVVRQGLAQGWRSFDFLGMDMPWKRDWTDSTRRHTWLYVFNRTLPGRLAWAAKFQWGPRAREVLTRWIR